MKKLNPNEAPAGYVAVEAAGCTDCAWRPGSDACLSVACAAPLRRDGCCVIFVKRQPPEPLDARYTIRLPASVKAKAQRIRAAAVIAAIVAAEDVT